MIRRSGRSPYLTDGTGTVRFPMRSFRLAA